MFIAMNFIHCLFMKTVSFLLSLIIDRPHNSTITITINLSGKINND